MVVNPSAVAFYGACGGPLLGFLPGGGKADEAGEAEVAAESACAGVVRTLSRVVAIKRSQQFLLMNRPAPCAGDHFVASKKDDRHQEGTREWRAA